MRFLAFVLVCLVHQTACFNIGPVTSQHGLLRARNGLQGVCMKSTQTPLTDRRSAIGAGLLGVIAPALPLSLIPAPALAADATEFKDNDRGFSVKIPSGWTEGVAEFPGASRNPARPRIKSFVNPENKEINVAIVSYSIQPDYSKLGSLGTIEDVAGTLIGRSGNLDAEVFSQSEKKAGGVPAYFFDYRIKDKHLLTVFAVQGGSWAGNYLVTLTAQAPAKDFQAAEKTLKSIADSFVLTSQN